MVNVRHLQMLRDNLKIGDILMLGKLLDGVDQDNPLSHEMSTFEQAHKEVLFEDFDAALTGAFNTDDWANLDIEGEYA